MAAWNIFTLTEIARSNDTCLQFFQDYNLLPRTKICVCGAAMQVRPDASVILLGVRWRCTRGRACRSSVSMLAGTFFVQLKISLGKVLMLLYYWSSKLPVSITAIHLDLSTTTVVDWYNLLREICSWKLLQNPIQFGGIGRVVQIDESVMVKAKYNRGRNLGQQNQWVFGIYDLETKKGYLTFVDRRDSDTLVPIIHQIVLPGSIIHSDMWRAYTTLDANPARYQHESVNHSRYFVDPNTGVHTNNIEAYWSRVKRRFKQMNGTSDGFIPSYLDEFMWRERYGLDCNETMSNIMLHISQRYN